METFEDMFKFGGHANSLGRASEVLTLLREDRSRMDELFACVLAEDAWVRMRAIDTFEKLVREDPTIAAPYLDTIFSDLIQSTQPSIQWHLAEIFIEVKLADAQQQLAVSCQAPHIIDT